MGRGTERPIGNRLKPHISLTDLLFCFVLFVFNEKKGRLIISLVNSSLSIFFCHQVIKASAHVRFMNRFVMIDQTIADYGLIVVPTCARLECQQSKAMLT